MALSFPLGLADFFNKLPVSEITFELPEAVEVNETQGGQLVRAELGERLWQGEVRLDVMMPSEAREALALINLARGGPASFVVTDAARRYPAADPNGSGLSGISPVLAAVSPDGREVDIGGLVAGYQLRAGDLVSLTYGSPLKYGLHEIVTGQTASAAGIATALEIVPQLRPGWSIGQAVRLANPICRAVIVPGSVQPGQRRAGIVRGASFRWVQTLGA